MKKIIMATAIFFAGLGVVTAAPKTHHKKSHHHVKHTKTTAILNKKDDKKNDKVKPATAMKTRTDKKK